LYSPAYVLADYIGIRGSQYLIHDRLDWYDVLGVYGQEIQYCGGVTPKRNASLLKRHCRARAAHPIAVDNVIVKKLGFGKGLCWSKRC
jgi:hypothetical protein